MKYKNIARLKQCAYLFLFLVFSGHLYAQLDLKRDDFVGNTNRGWWRWHSDGPNTPMPAVSNGYVLFSLVDPIASYSPYCNSALWDGYPVTGGPYNENVTVIMRIRAMNPHRNGSRGWGLWYTEGDFFNVRQQIWFMRNIDDPDLTGVDWWLGGVKHGDSKYVVDLTQEPYLVDDEFWHIYEIIRDPNFITIKVDGETIISLTEDLPDRNMAFHLWVDNLIYADATTYRRSWIGSNDVVMDYLQIHSQGALGQSVTPSGIMLLREVSNELYTVPETGLWKNYSFDASDGQNIILITARVEQYLDSNLDEISSDDDIRFEIDGTNYGWNTANSFNGDDVGTVSKTLLFEQTMTSGTKYINIYGETSPLLYDVTVLGSSGGGIIYNNEFNETKTAGSNELWYEIPFQTWGGEVAFYISGSADEDPVPSDHYGYQYTDFNNNDDDDLKISIDETDYGYQNDNALWGNRLFGEPKSILVTQTLSQGQHTLRISGLGTPTLYQIVIYGENDDVSLPVTLSGFSVQLNQNGNILSWETASEIDNLGFNIYRAASDNSDEPETHFNKINNKLIPGLGSSSSGQNYSYLDQQISDNTYFWYFLEDISLSGIKTVHDTIMINRTTEYDFPEIFSLSQNYPNPFNPKTVISYNLPTDDNVNLSVYDLLGQKVCSLVSQKQQAGTFNVTFDARDLVSGVYYYQLKTSSGSSNIKKMILVK